MSDEHTSREWQRIRELADEYGLKGYEVVYPRTKLDVPDFLRQEDYIPDLVVTSADEKLIIEVKTTESVRHDKHIAKISELVKQNPGWQFLFVLANPKRGESASVRLPSRERWHQLLEQSRHLALQAPELKEAAFVLAWAAFEGAVREAAVSESTGSASKLPTAKSLMSELRDAVILGLVDRKDLPQLEQLLEMRNCIVHANDGPRPSATDIAFLHNLVDEFARTPSNR